MTGPWVLVAGASRGIGLAAARLLLNEGYSVVASAREVDTLAERLGEMPGERLKTVPFDFARVERIQDYVSEVAGLTGGIAGLLYAAGMQKTLPLTQSNFSLADEIFRVNTFAAFELIRLFAKKGAYSPLRGLVRLDFLPGRARRGVGKGPVRGQQGGARRIHTRCRGGAGREKNPAEQLGLRRREDGHVHAVYRKNERRAAGSPAHGVPAGIGRAGGRRRVHSVSRLRKSALDYGADIHPGWRAFFKRNPYREEVKIVRDVVIYGAGGLGREVRAYLRAADAAERTWNFLGFIDDGKPADTPMGDAKILGDRTKLISAEKPTAVLMGIADPAAKASLYAELSRNPRLSFPVLVHPLAHVEPSAVLGEGTIISPHCDISIDAVLGVCVFVNAGAQVGHDSVLGDFCSVMPHVDISGNVTVGARTLIGVGAQILQGLSIGSDVTVGIGSTVLNDIPDRCTVMGYPARAVKKAGRA
jgi:sugar O-acyltransferase (sialic acid O-acetyltransferase NeuD family)